MQSLRAFYEWCCVRVNTIKRVDGKTGVEIDKGRCGSERPHRYQNTLV